MDRQSGDITKHEINRAYPHQVAVKIPLKGDLGTRIEEMQAYCRERGLPFCTQTDRRSSGESVRYCFVDPTHADVFAKAFGGERSTVVLHDK